MRNCRPITQEIIDEFLKLVPNFSSRSRRRCWLWKGHTFDNGYGSIRIKRKSYVIHRISYAVVYGDPGGNDVHHECKNEGCFNPDHLRSMDGSAHSKLHVTDETRRKCRERNVRRWEKPGERDKMKEVSRRMWDDPEMAAKQRDRLRAMKRGPNGRIVKQS